MAVSDPKQPNILDIISGSYDPSGSISVPGPLRSILAPAMSPDTVSPDIPGPEAPGWAASHAAPIPIPAPIAPKGPTLGTPEQLTAPSEAAQRGPAEGGSWSADGKTLTLPPRSAENSSEPLSMVPDRPGFLKTLGRLAGGAVGFTDPNSSPQASLGAKIGGLIGRTGTALALAAGTPEEKSAAAEQLQMPVKLAQIENEREWRRGMLGINQQNANTKGQVAATGAKTEEDKYALGDAAMGLPPGTSRMTAMAAAENAASNEKLRAKRAEQIDAMMNGETLVTPEAAYAAGNPSLANKRLPALAYQQQITNPIKNQLVASGGTKTVDLGDDGVWGYNPLLGRTVRLGDSPSVARANSLLLRTQIPQNDAQGNIVGWVNPQTNTVTPVTAIHGKNGGPSLSELVGGNVVPPKPTSSVLSRGQVAQTILPQVPVIQKEIADVADKIGPGAGRWNDFWVNKGGVNDPDYAGLNQDLQLYATAVAMAHFGASGSQAYVDALMKDFSQAQSPENLAMRVEHAEGWIEGYANRVGGGKGALKPGTSTPTKLTPAQYLAQKKAGK